MHAARAQKIWVRIMTDQQLKPPALAMCGGSGSFGKPALLGYRSCARERWRSARRRLVVRALAREKKCQPYSFGSSSYRRRPSLYSRPCSLGALNASRNGASRACLVVRGSWHLPLGERVPTARASHFDHLPVRRGSHPRNRRHRGGAGRGGAVVWLHTSAARAARQSYRLERCSRSLRSARRSKMCR